jgi:antitoxin HicB
MYYVYPANVERDEAGFFLVTFPDVPEAATDGETPEQGLNEAQDALVAALGGYVNADREIPAPTAVQSGQTLIYLPPLIAAKLALYQAMREMRISNAELARRLKLSEGAIRRLVDLDHRSRIQNVDAALEVLGKHLIVAAA